MSSTQPKNFYRYAREVIDYMKFTRQKKGRLNSLSLYNTHLLLLTGSKL